jgi:hypothetical protein
VSHRTSHRRPRLLAVVLLAAATGLAGTALVAAPAQAAATRPSGPRSVTVANPSAGTVKVSWAAPASTGGSPITRYTIGWSTGQAGGGAQTGAAARSYSFHDFPKGTFTFSVFATNAVGDSTHVSKQFTVTTGGLAPSIAASATRLTAGSTLTLSGKGYAGSWLTLERALPGGAWTALPNSIQAASTGAWHTTLTVKNTASYRIRGGSGAVSAGRKVVVANRMTLTATNTAGRTYTLAGTVYPGSAGQVVTLATKGADGTYSTLTTVTTDATGHWSWNHTFAAATYDLRAVSTATTRNAAGTAILSLPVS